MKKLILALLGLSLLASPAFAATKKSEIADIVQQGASTVSDKDYVFNIGAGANNPKIRAKASTNKVQFCHAGDASCKDIGSGSGGSGSGVVLNANPGFEDGTDNWTASGGTFVINSTLSNVGFGVQSGSWDASASSQTLSGELVAVPAGLYGQICSMTWYHKGGDANLKAQVFDGTNVIAEQVLSAHTDFGVQQFMLFTCPSSGSIRPRFISTANAALAYFDEVRVGQERVYGNNVTDYPNTAYTPVITGLGTVSGVTFFHSRRGDKLEVVGKVTAATVQAALASVSLPGSLLIDSALPANTTSNAGPLMGGYQQTGVATTAGGMVTALGTSNSVVYFGGTTTTAGMLVPQNGSTILTNSLEVGVYFSVPIEGWAEEMPVQALSVDKSGWYIDAQLGGANISLSTVAVPSYTEMTDAGLSLILNTGSASAEVPCSGTNPSTGLTCATGNESLGVSFSPPSAGVYEVCGLFNPEVNSAPGSGFYATYQWKSTPNNAQTVLASGGEAAQLGTQPSGGSVTVSSPSQVCGTFIFSDTSKQTLRLMYTAYFNAGGTANVHTIWMDRLAVAGDRDMKIKVRRKVEYNESIKFTNMVTTNHAEGEKIERVFFAGASSTTACSSSPCVVYSQSGSWISSVTRASAGNYTLNIVPGTFTSPPVCTCSGSGDINGSSICNVLFSNVTTTSVNMTNVVQGVGSVDQGDHLVCMGSK